MNRIFIDTNILVYALDKDEGSKYQTAKSLLQPFFQSQKAQPVISSQVLHEFSYRLFRWGFSDSKVQTLIQPMTYWNVISNDLALFSKGLEIKQRYQTSFWDGLILAAAIISGAREIWSEDFNTGQNYDGVVAVNPFE